MPAHTLTLMLAAWLFVSAFGRPHSTASFVNTWAVGVLSAIVAVVSMRWDGAARLVVARRLRSRFAQDLLAPTARPGMRLRLVLERCPSSRAVCRPLGA